MGLIIGVVEMSVWIRSFINTVEYAVWDTSIGSVTITENTQTALFDYTLLHATLAFALRFCACIKKIEKCR